MEKLDGETEMPAAEQNSEQSRLIGSNMPSRISYMNLISNLSALLFVGIIIYCCCAKENASVLFSFHPILMALGVSDAYILMFFFHVSSGYLPAIIFYNTYLVSNYLFFIYFLCCHELLFIITIIIKKKIVIIMYEPNKYWKC